jgi:hypothetical protein
MPTQPKLNRAQRALCRALRADKWKLHELLAEFSCSYSTIERVLCNTYRDVLSEGTRLSSRYGLFPRVVTLLSRR